MRVTDQNALHLRVPAQQIEHAQGVLGDHADAVRVTEAEPLVLDSPLLVLHVAVGRAGNHSPIPIPSSPPLDGGASNGGSLE